MADNVEILNTDTFEAFISKGNAVVDFYADWCGPCKQMAPAFDEAANELNDVSFGKVNVDGNQEIAGQFGVMSIPTVIFFKGTEQVDRHTGPLTAEEIKQRAKQAFS